MAKWATEEWVPQKKKEINMEIIFDMPTPELKEAMEKKINKELPFLCEVGDEPEIVANRFTGQEVELQPEAVAVYDTIMGAEMMEQWPIVRKGITWFRQNYPEEYMVLLD